MDLAGMDVVIGADLSKLYAELNKGTAALQSFANTANKLSPVLDTDSKQLAKVTAASAATAGGVSDLGESFAQLKNNINPVPKSFEALEDSFNGFISAFNSKWNPIIADAEKLAGPLNQAAIKAAELQRQVSTFGGGVLQFKAAGVDQVLQQSKLIVDAINGLPTSTIINFQLSSNTQAALSELGNLSTEINELGNGGAVSIDRINTALGQLRTASTNATNVTNIKQYDNAINLLKKDLTGITETVKKSGVSLSTIGGSSDVAGQALQNLGRVAQDLPYGFIGISNNLNPLLESFQRLSGVAKQTGVSVTSLLVKSLTGAGGLGIALSAVTAAFSFATIGMQFWTRGLGSSKKAADDAIQSNEDYAKSLADIDNNAVKSAQKQITEFQLLINSAKDVKLALNERLDAANKLQEQSGYFAALSKEQILYGNITDAVNQAREAILNKFYADAAGQKAAESAARVYLLTKQQTEVQKELNKAQEDYNRVGGTASGQGGTGYLQIIGRLQSKLKDITDQLKDATKDQNSFLEDSEKFKRLSANVVNAAIILAKLNNQIDLLNKKSIATGGDFKTEKISDYKKAVDDLLSLPQTAETKKDIDDIIAKIKALGGSFDEAAKRAKATIGSTLADLDKQINFLNGQQINLRIDQSQGKITAIEQVVKKLVTDLNVPIDSALIKGLYDQINTLQHSFLSFDSKDFLPSDFGKKFIDSIQKSIPDITPPKIPVEIKPVYNKEAFEDIVKRAQIDVASRTLDLNLDLSSISGNEVTTLLKPLNDANEAAEKLKNIFGIGLPDNIQKALAAFNKLDFIKNKLVDLNSTVQLLSYEYGTNLPAALQKYVDAANAAAKAGDSKNLISNLNLLNESASALATAQEIIDRRGLKVPIELDPKQLAQFAQDADSIIADMESIIKNAFADIFITIGEAIGGGDDIFGKFRDILGGALKSLGADLVKLGTLALLAKLALKDIFKNPLLEIGIGIALTALGTQIEAKSRVAFAEGGIAMPRPGGIAATIAEAGVPELVMPVTKIKDYFQPSAGDVNVIVSGEFRQRGDDMVAFITKAVKKYYRNY